MHSREMKYPRPSLQNKKRQGPCGQEFFCFINHPFPQALAPQGLNGCIFIIGQNKSRLVKQVGSRFISCARLSFRLPQALHHGVFGDGAVHRQGDQGAQQGKHRSHRQDGGQGEAVGEEPEHALKGGEGQGAQDHRQDQGQEHRAQGVQQALTDQHGLQLLSGHADGLEHGELPLAGDDAGEDGVEEVQHAHQPHDETEGPAAQLEHGAHPLELRCVERLALIVELGIHVLRVVCQELLHGAVGLVGGIKGVVHHHFTSLASKGLSFLQCRKKTQFPLSV